MKTFRALVLPPCFMAALPGVTASAAFLVTDQDSAGHRVGSMLGEGSPLAVAAMAALLIAVAVGIAVVTKKKKAAKKPEDDK